MSTTKIFYLKQRWKRDNDSFIHWVKKWDPFLKTIFFGKRDVPDINIEKLATNACKIDCCPYVFSSFLIKMTTHSLNRTVSLYHGQSIHSKLVWLIRLYQQSQLFFVVRFRHLLCLTNFDKTKNVFRIFTSENPQPLVKIPAP